MTPPATGHFVLHSRVLPKVVAGSYQLRSSLTGTPFPVREERTHVHVAAPRFTMPPEQILSSFPPANAEGSFGDRLPQVVLKRRTLPWERNPFGGNLPVSTPWLALVVVAEGEAELSGPTPVGDCVTPPSTLDFGDRDVDQGVYLAVTQRVVDKVFPCQDDLPLLAHVREVDVNDTELANGDDDGWLAVVLANRLPVPDKATGRPVRYLACLVNLEGQLESLPQPTAPNDFFTFELAEDWQFLVAQAADPDQVVMGSGFGVASRSLDPDAPPPSAPRAAGLARASTAAPGLGASIDGAATQDGVARGAQWAAVTEAVAAAATDPDAARLVRDTMGQGWRSPISKYAVDPVLRFPVLAHWSFTTAAGATFEALLRGLDVGLLGTIPPPLPRDPPRPATSEVVATGHIHLTTRTRRGDRAASWYRGPLAPHPTLRDAPVGGRLPLAHSADQLRRVVPDGGEDLGTAAGFEIGRLLALSQLSVVSALLRFRGEQFGRARVRRLLDTFVPFADVLVGAERDLARLVSATVVESLATDPTATVGPARPVADAGRPLARGADLDDVLAAGLGLDLPRLRKTADAIGMLAALARTDVPVARDDEGSVDEPALDLLRGALEAKVLEVAEIALPALRSPAAPPGARRAAPSRDPLDELIAGASTYADDPDEP